MPYPFLRILALNLDGFRAAVDETRERKCEPMIRASREYDIITVAEAHVGRLYMVAVKEFARKNGLVVLSGVHASEVDDNIRAATRAHDSMHYDSSNEGNRAEVLTFVTQKVMNKFVVSQTIIEEIYQQRFELRRKSTMRWGRMRPP